MTPRRSAHAARTPCPPRRCLLGLALAAALPSAASELAGPIVIDDGNHHTFADATVLHDGPGAALTVRGGPSHAHLHDSQVHVNGPASGVLVEDGGSARLTDTRLEVGGSGWALRASGAQSHLQASGVRISAAGPGANGLLGSHAGATLMADDLHLAGAGTLAHASGSGSMLHLANSTLAGSGRARLIASAGARLEISRSQLDLGAAQGGPGTGILASGDATVTLLDSEYRNGFIDIGSGARLEMRRVSADNDAGSLRLLGDAVRQQHSTALIENSHLRSRGDIAINVNRWGALQLTGSVVDSAPGTGSAALWLSSDSSRAAVTSSGISVRGDGRHAVEMHGGQLEVNASRITVSGGGGTAVRATGSTGSTRTALAVRGLEVALEGADSTGVLLGGSRVQADLQDLHIRGTGARSIGVAHVNTAALAPVHGLHLALAGSGAIGWRSYLTVAGDHWNRATLHDSRIDTPAGTALRLQGGHHALALVDSRINQAHPGGALLRVGDTVFTDGSRVAAGRYEVRAARSLLDGDIWVDSDSARLSLRLEDGTHWRGTLHGDARRHATALHSAHGSHWSLGGGSSVGTLQHAGVIDLPGAAGNGFGRLTVEGDYHGDNGLFGLATRLGGDDAPTDLLHIRGSASGSARLQVRNAGGAGAATAQGIRVVQVDGPSQATFQLQGRAVAGAYEYFLHHGSAGNPADGHWYLRSVLPGTPCEQDPQGPGCAVVPPVTPPVTPPVVPPVEPPIEPPIDRPDPLRPGDGVLRPEAGAWQANRAAALRMFEHTLHERAGDAPLPAASSTAPVAAGWARVQQRHHRQQRGVSLHERGRADVLHAGTDLARWGTQHGARVGVMVAHGNSRQHVRQPATGIAAQARLQGRAAGVYATWRAGGDGDARSYLDGWVQAARWQGSVQGEGLARERDGARGWLASMEAGHAFALSTRDSLALFVQPQVQLSANAVRARTALHHEANGTAVQWDDRRQWRSRLGVRVHGHARSGDTRVQPFAAVDWERRHGSGSALWMDHVQMGRVLPARVLRTRAGAQLQLRHGLSAWGELQLERGDAAWRGSSALLGLRYHW